MAAIAAGDDRVFATVVSRETPRLLRFARSLLTASPGEADEIVQEALLRLWQQAPTWQPAGQIGTWLHRVTYRLCVDSLRRMRPSVDIDAVQSELEDMTPRADTRLARMEDAQRIRAAVEALPGRQRTAVILCHFQGLPQAEAAAVMGLSEHAYESLLARGRRRLRAVLFGEDGAGEGGLP